MRFIDERLCFSAALCTCLSSSRGESGRVLSRPSIEQAGCVLIFLLLNLVGGESLGASHLQPFAVFKPDRQTWTLGGSRHRVA